jgi:hypothetical protein
VKQALKIIIILSIILFSFSLLQANDQDMASIFPTMEGWTPKGDIAFYSPDNLYEYIDGAADVFLSYDFVKLASLTLVNKDKQSFPVDVYRHNNDRNGFGIYCQEKPRKGPFIAIGAQGYYETGVLNFLRGSYYVKISGFDLGEKDQDVLTAYAKKLAEKLEGPTTFPAVVLCFPKEEMVQDSQGFIAKNFLGHAFLHSAYVADYEMDGRNMQVFIMEGKDETETRAILDSYLDFVKKKGMEVEEKEGLYRFQDPYYRSNGKMNMKLKGNYLWGLFSRNDEKAGEIIGLVETNLKKSKLIQ